MRKDRKGLLVHLRWGKGVPKKKELALISFLHPSGSWFPFEFPRKWFIFCTCSHVLMFMTLSWNSYPCLFSFPGLLCGCQFSSFPLWTILSVTVSSLWTPPKFHFISEPRAQPHTVPSLDSLTGLFILFEFLGNFFDTLINLMPPTL